ncbi:MAG: GGDEF domain-containing protein [Halothiobacillaceae bacterium]
MSRDLFGREKEAIARARGALDSRCPDELADALGHLIDEFERVVRDTRRLINHSDRSERELNRANRRLRELTDALDWKSRHDGLTGLLNRAALIDHAQELMKEHALGLVLVDVDHFKKINDTYGHPVGDIVLRSVAECLASVAGPDRCGRMGGEEFALLCPLPEHERTPEGHDQGFRLATQGRECVQALDFEVASNLNVTASFGVAYADAGVLFDRLYLVADDMLYQAKTNGRNRVEFSPDPVRS